MEKLNFKKESVIEILRLIENQVIKEHLSLPYKSTIVLNFSVYIYIKENQTEGDVYFGKIGYLK